MMSCITLTCFECIRGTLGGYSLTADRCRLVVCSLRDNFMQNGIHLWILAIESTAIGLK